MFSALLLSLALLSTTGPTHAKGHHPMPLVLLFKEAFAPGSSLFCSPRMGAGGTQDYYETSAPTGTVDAPDSLYPDMSHAEAVGVSTGGGPAGQNLIDLAITGGGGDDYSTAGVWLHIPQVVTPGVGTFTRRGVGVVATSGVMIAEVWVYSTATSIADNSYGPIMYLNYMARAGGYGSINLSHLKIGGVQHLEIHRPSAWNGGGVSDQSYVLTGYQDVWMRYRIYIGVSSAPGVADGYYIVTHMPLAGTETVAYNITGIVVDESADASSAVYLTEATTAPSYRVADALLGYFGLFGKVADFRLYDATETTDTLPSTSVVNISEACCANPPVTGSVPDPIGTFPAPTYTCEGGGVVEQVDDLPGMDGCFGTVAALSPVPLPVVLTPPPPVAEAPEPPTDVDFA